MVSHVRRILILCKTYPSPSARHAETSCVAGALEDGTLIRLYPVPFRLVSDDQQFKKWQWIKARIEKAPADHRPESHKIYVDTIECLGDPIPVADDWALRRPIIDLLPVYPDFGLLESMRQRSGRTLGVVRPTRVLGLDVTPSEHQDWTDEEKAKLLQLQNQGNLFDAAEETRTLRLLKKIPFEFHYRYQCDVDGKSAEYRHKLVDWEVGMLYWNVRRQHGARWEEPFRDKIERYLPQRDLLLLMGTIHRFPDRWLAVSLIYPPRQQQAQAKQMPLL